MNLIKWLDDFFSAKENVIIEELKLENKKLNKILKGLEKENVIILDEINILTKQIALSNINKNILDYEEQYMDAHEKSSYKYDFKREGRERDIKYALGATETGIEAIKELGMSIIKGKQISDPTAIITYVMTYFSKSTNWTYVYDEQNKEQGYKKDYWQIAEKSLVSREGDCDDLAILIHNICYYLLLEYHPEHVWRLEFVTAKILSYGGHAFNKWLGDSGEWYVVESTYDLAGSLKRSWLKVPMIYNNFYEQMYAFATKTKSWYGSLSSLKNQMV